MAAKETNRTPGDRMGASVSPAVEDEQDNPVPASDQPSPGTPTIAVRPDVPEAGTDYQIVVGGLDADSLYSIRVSSPIGQEGIIVRTGDDGSASLSFFSYDVSDYTVSVHASGAKTPLATATFASVAQ